MATSKRLLQELKLSSGRDDSADGILQLGPRRDDDMYHWQAVIHGVAGTAYEGEYDTFRSLITWHIARDRADKTGGLWQLDIVVPDNYPLSPPRCTFSTPICHPNVHFSTGEICLDLLKTSWSPAYTLRSTVQAIHQLLTSAEPDSPLNVDIAQLLRVGDDEGATSLIRYYTHMFRWSG